MNRPRPLAFSSAAARRRLAALVFSVTVAVFAVASGSAQAEPVSGDYGALNLVVRDGRVGGLYWEGRLFEGPDGAPRFSCIFFLEGALEGDVAKLDTWLRDYPERYSGTIRFDGDDAFLRLEENHGGCLMTSGDMTREPLPLERISRRDEWIGVGLVSAERAILRPTPAEEPGRTRPYLVDFDPVAVLERDGDWLKVVLLSREDGAVGWLRMDELDITPDP